MEELYIGVDLGGTKILAGIFDSDHHCLASEKTKTNQEDGYDAVCGQIVETIHAAAELAGIDPAKVNGAGIGAPGSISSDESRVLFAPNLGWRDAPLKADLEAELGCPVWLGNDCNVAATGIHRLELEAKPNDMVSIFLGTGIGAGIITNGVFLTGATRAAGEVGHMVLDPDGPVCGCGTRGCFEALASRTAIFNKVKSAVNDGAKTLLMDAGDDSVTRIRSGKLRRAIEAGDELAAAVLGETCLYTGVAIANLCNLLNPEVVALGGGLIEQLQADMLPKIRDAALERIMPGARQVRIMATALGDAAGITGAAILAHDHT
ncbi:MAG: ROK family protein [Verrucomicrobia bacterium]|nr:MAG: ROK family protein [Verrucomicrobiota bacterium]